MLSVRQYQDRWQIRHALLGIFSEIPLSEKASNLLPDKARSGAFRPINAAQYHAIQSHTPPAGFADHEGVLMPSPLSAAWIQTVLMAIKQRIPVTVRLTGDTTWQERPLLLTIGPDRKVRSVREDNKLGLKLPWHDIASIELNKDML